MALAGLALAAGAATAQANDQTSDRAAKATAGNVSRPAIGSKTMASCTIDKQKVCAMASDYMAKECLVKNWDVISSDCQDALGKPFDGAAPHRD
jgi:hypothetical protein